jgi:hypothetical protein
VSEAELDTLTGDWHLLRTDLCMDVGHSLNPAIDIGQARQFPQTSTLLLRLITYSWVLASLLNSMRDPTSLHLAAQ